MPAKNPRIAFNPSNPETKAQMERLAAEHFRTLSAEIEAACWAWIKSHEGQAPQS